MQRCNTTVVAEQQYPDSVPLAELKFMEAQCLIAAREPGAAIASLEGISKPTRTAEMNATLARVYENSGLKRYDPRMIPGRVQ